MLQTELKIQEAFTQEIRDALINVIMDAYSSNMQRFNPEMGDDSMLFGLMLYKFKFKYIMELALRNNWLRIRQRAPQFIFSIGDYNLSAYRVGEKIDADVNRSFPKNKRGASKLTLENLGQLRLQFDEGNSEVDDSNCRDLILADMGSDTEGVGKIFLGVPSRIENGLIAEWSTTVTLWERGEGYQIIRPTIPAPELPPAETIVKPDLTLKKKPKVNEQK